MPTQSPLIFSVPAVLFHSAFSVPSALKKHVQPNLTLSAKLRSFFHGSRGSGHGPRLMERT